MGLDKGTRKCQNIETYDDCKTQLHEEHLRQECGCLPLSLRLSDKVKCIVSRYQKTFSGKHLMYVNQQDALCMTNKEIKCSETITTPNSTSCMRLY